MSVVASTPASTIEPTDTVTSLRISYVAARSHSRIEILGRPDLFERHLIDPQPVAGLLVGRPFAPGLAADLLLWSDLSEVDLDGGPLDEAAAKRLRRAGVPLRHAATVAADAVERGSLEIHLLPYGVAAIVTAELVWPQGLALAEAWTAAAQVSGAPVDITVASTTRSVPLEDAADAAVELVLGMVGGADGQTSTVSTHRIATVVDGSVVQPPAALPTPSGPVHTALHRLSGGGDTLGDLALALVPQWSGTSFTFPPASLVYMIDVGTAAWLPHQLAAGAQQRPSLGDRHRRATLLVAHLASSVALIRAQVAKTRSVYFESWAKDAANRLARLFGPKTPSLADGLAVRWYLERTSSRPDVEQVLGQPLVERLKPSQFGM